MFYYTAGGPTLAYVDSTVPGTTVSFPSSLWLVTLPAGTFEPNSDVYVVVNNVGQSGGQPFVSVGLVGNAESDGSFDYAMPQSLYSNWLHFSQTARIYPAPN